MRLGVKIGIMTGNYASWGQGIGVDAFCTVVQEIERGGEVRKITAGAASEIKAMIRILERAGFELEAMRRGQELLEGQPVDRLYSTLFCHV